MDNILVLDFGSHQSQVSKWQNKNKIKVKAK
jgi:hypothetical protein